MRWLADDSGLIGKIAIVWLLILALILVAAVDAASIAFTTYKLSDVGSAAASEGALVFDKTHDVRDACDRVVQVMKEEDPAVRLAKGGCSVERPSGLVTVKVRKDASTLVAERIPWTQEFATVVVTETSGPPSL